MTWILLAALLLIFAVDLVATAKMRVLYARVRRLEWELSRRRVADGPRRIVDVHIPPGTSPEATAEAMVRAIHRDMGKGRSGG